MTFPISNEGLMIQIESLERDVIDRDMLIEDVRAELGTVWWDLD